MAIELSGKDLGVAGCDYTASGETPADVVDQMAEHLRKKHDIDMPGTQTIMEGRTSDNPIIEGTDDRVALIIRRMHSELDIPRSADGPDAEPAVGQVTGR